MKTKRQENYNFFHHLRTYCLNFISYRLNHSGVNQDRIMLIILYYKILISEKSTFLKAIRALYYEIT